MTVEEGIPEDFDLEAARAAPSTTPTEEMDRCPSCGTTVIAKTVPGKPGSQDVETKYRCKRTGCREHFDEPAPPLSEVDDDE